MVTDDKRKALYDAVGKEYNLGTYEEFTQKLSDPVKRKVLYDAVGQQYSLGTFDEFEAKVQPDVKKKDISESPQESGTSKLAGVEDPLLQGTEVIPPVAGQVSPPAPQTTPGSEVEKGVLNTDTPKTSAGLPKAPEVNQKPKGLWDSLKETMGVIQDQSAQYAEGALKNINVGLAGVAKHLDTASKAIHDVTGLDYGGGFGKLHDWMQKNTVDNLQDVPDGIAGDVIKQAGQLSGLTLEMAISPQMSILKLPMVLGTSGALDKYSEVSDKNIPLKEKAKEVAGAFETGAAAGSVFALMGVGGGALKNIVVSKTGSDVLGYIANLATNSGGFAGYTALEGGDKKQVISSALLGGLLTVPEVAKMVFGSSVNKAINTSDESIKAINDANIEPEKILDKIQEIDKDINEQSKSRINWSNDNNKFGEYKIDNENYIEVFNEPRYIYGQNRIKRVLLGNKLEDRWYVDEQGNMFPNGGELKSFATKEEAEAYANEMINRYIDPINVNELETARTVLENTLVTNAGIQMIKENPAPVIESINSSDLTPTEKKIAVDKVNAISDAVDPQKIATRPITDQIDKLDTELNQIEQAPDHPAVKEIKTKAIKEKKAALTDKLTKVVAPELVKEEKGAEPEPETTIKPTTGNPVKTTVFRSSEKVDETQMGEGIFFTSDKGVAQSYIDPKGKEKLHEAEISMQNPLVIDAKGQDWQELIDGKDRTEWVEQAKKDGHDGLIIKNQVDVGGMNNVTNPSDIYVVFDKKNITPQPSEGIKSENVKPQTPIDNSKKGNQKGQQEVLSPETAGEVRTEPAVKPSGAEIGMPNKEVSVSAAKAVDDVIKGLNKDLKPMEATMLYSEMKGKNTADFAEENGTELMIIGEKGLKPQMFKSLEKKGYVFEMNNGEYAITPSGEEFIKRVNARLETRQGVKEGTDLFPEMANIPEFDAKIKEVKSIEPISDETIKRITEQDPTELEQSATDIESQASSSSETDLNAAIKQADAIIGEEVKPIQSKPTVQSLQEELAQGKWAGRMPEFSKAMEAARRNNQQGSTKSSIPTSLIPKGEPIKASGIISKVEKALGIPVRIGKIRVKKFAGIYKTREEVIRLREANDLATMSHEIAHDIDKKTGFRKTQLGKEMRDELRNLDYDPKQKRVSEGFAEFVRHYITTDDAATVAPKFNDYFENTFLKDNPKYAKIIQDAKTEVTQWRQQGSLARVLSQIDFDGKSPENILSFKERAKRFDAKVRSIATNRLYPIKYVVNQMLKSAGIDKLRPSNDPYQIAMATSKTAAASARQFVLEGTFDDALQKTGKSLKEIVTPIAHDVNNALAYAYARRAVNLHDRGINPGISKEDAQFVIDNHYKPEYEQFAKDLTEWSEKIVDYLVDAGGLSKEGADRMRELNPVYIMLKRSFSDAKGGSAGKGFVDLPTPIKGIKGSGRNIANPLKSMISQTEQIIGVANKARVARALADIVETNQGLGKWMEKLPPPMQRSVVELENIKKQIEDIGGDLSQADMDAMITIFSQGKSYYGKDNIVAIYREGKREYYQLDPMLYDALKGMDNITLPWFLNYTFGTASRLIRLGATGIRAGFSLISNPARDVATAGLQSEHGGGGRVDKIAKGIYDEILNKGKYIKEYRRSGVEMAQPLGVDRKMMNGLLQEALADNVQRKALGIVKHPVEALRKILSVTESGVRYAEFEATMKAYEPLIEKAKADGDLVELKKLQQDRAIEATNAANEVTVNFKRAGTYGAVLNQLIPFFNPAVQGLSRMGRTMYEHPLRSGMRAIAGLTAPTLALWWINKDEEWYKELPTWQKYAFWNFKIGDTMIRIPRPFEWGYLFAGIPEGVVNSVYQSDPKYFKDAAYEAVTNIPPSMIPGLVKPAIEVYFNWDIFRERPIVSRGLEGLMPAQQYQSYTSDVAKKVGEVLNVSPLSIDHLLSGYTGGLATDILNAFPKEYKEKSDWPIIGRLFTRQSTIGFGGQSVQDFYDIYQRFNSISKTINNSIKNIKPIMSQGAIDSARQQIQANLKSLTDAENFIKNINADSTIRINREALGDTLPKNISQKDLDLYVYKDVIGKSAKTMTELRNMQKLVNDMNLDKDIKKQINDSINVAAAKFIEEVVISINKRKK